MYKPVLNAPAAGETRSREHPRTAVWERLVADLRRRFGDPIPKAALGGFFHRLAALLASGQSVPECLRGAAGPDPDLRWLADTAAGPTSMGAPLYRALLPCRDRLPEIVLPVLEVGEVSGTLESASRRLADAFDRSSGVERKFEYTVFNPRFVVLLLAF